MYRYAGLTLAASLVVSTGAFAQTATSLGQFRDWTVWTYTSNGNKVCYVSSQPKDMEPKNVNRDPTYFFVTSRPAEGVKGEPSVIIGYPFREGSRVTVEIDGQTFNMFTKDDGAWLEDPSQEAAFLQALRAGSRMIVRGTSRRGTNTVDTYSLAGSTDATDKMAEACR